MKLQRFCIACVATVMLAAPVMDGVQPTPEVELGEAERLFDEFQFEPAIAVLDGLVGSLTQPGVDRPDRLGLLARSYELRGRARFNAGLVADAEIDFVELLRTDATFRLPNDLSPRLLELFNAVRADTVGLLFLAMDPPGIVLIDGREFPMPTPREVFELPVGPHTVTTSLAGYRPQTLQVTVLASQSVELVSRLVRIFGSLTVATSPPGARVVVDGDERDITAPGDDPDGPSAPALVLDLEPGDHALRIERDCHIPYDASFNIPDPPVDADVGVIELEPAVATAVIQTVAPNASVYVDGERRDAAPAELTDICAGEHVVEVRSPAGRYIDRRDWRRGETVTLDARLRQAFALIPSEATSDVAAAARLLLRVEEALGDARRAMVFAPPATDVTAAAAQGAAPNEAALSILERRDAVDRWTDQLGSQGVAWIEPAADDPETLTLYLLARGSGVPDALAIRLADLGSRAAAARTLSVPPQPVVRPSLEASLVDVEGVTGAAVVRVQPDGTSARAGLLVGDIVISVDGDAVSSARDVGRLLASHAGGDRLVLEIASPQRDASVTVTVAEAPDAVPLTDRTRLSNLLLLDMEETLARAEAPLAEAAARLNLAVAHARLSNWDLALRELEQVTLPDGPGVSAGTVAYFTGLCLIEISQLTAAEEALRRAVAAVWRAGSSSGGRPSHPSLNSSSTSCSAGDVDAERKSTSGGGGARPTAAPRRRAQMDRDSPWSRGPSLPAARSCGACSCPRVPQCRARLSCRLHGSGSPDTHTEAP